MKKIHTFTTCAAVFMMAALILTGCRNVDLGLDAPLGGSPVEYTASVVDEEAYYTEGESTVITLNGNSVEVKGTGVTVNGSVITVTAAGDYILSGTLNDGQVIVDAGKKDKVHVILSGASIHCETSACIYVKKAKKCVITLADGTVNYLSDGSAYTYTDVREKEPNAAVFSENDLKLNGNGTVTVEGTFGHAIRSKRDITITGGNWNLTAASDGIKARDEVKIKDGRIVITADNDGIVVAGNESDDTSGSINMLGGILIVKAEQDGIQAALDINISGGTLDIITGGGSGNASTSSGWGFWGNSGDTTSAKAVKAGGSVTIEDGVFTINSSDDAIHCDKAVTINAGTFDINSGDDGIHAGADMVINGGKINIEKSYEGFEALSITINDGDISIVSTDDGMNAAGGSKDVHGAGRFGGENPFAVTEGAAITINGGNIYVNAAGDGIDSNGDLYVSGGIIMVDGPTDNGNGALDHNGSAIITGGTIIASGSSGMIENFDSTSTQHVILAYFGSTLSAKTEVEVRDSEGNTVVTYTTAKQSRCAIISCPEFAQDATYTVYVNGEENCSITCSDIISSNGSINGEFGGFGGPGGPGGFGGFGERPDGERPDGERPDFK